MQPKSFCSLATYGCHSELFGLLLSISVHHKGAIVYCAVDTKTKEYIENSSPEIDLAINWIVSLDEYSGLDRDTMEKKGVWSDFQMQKAIVIDEALKREKDTLFLDADILLLDAIDDIDDTKQLGVSPHYINKNSTDTFGYYNGGVLWTNQKSVKDDWIEFTKTSRYFDQASIEDLAKKYDTFEFGENYNFSWWRVTQSDQAPQEIINELSIVENKINYKGAPLKFVHTHFYETREDVKLFNDVIVQCLNQIKDYKSLLIIKRMVDGKWKIQIPEQPMVGKWSHSNDSFRELLGLIEDSNSDLELELVHDSGHVWLNNSILLYDRPTINWIDRQAMSCYKLLLGNGDINQEGVKLKEKGINVSPWIFWPRRPSVLEKKLDTEGLVSYNERNIESIFIGNYENYIQQEFRNNQKWEDVIQEFYCTAGSKHKFSQEEYLDKIRHSKYGLCLRGFGSKCHREVELIAFGTVPLVTPEVSINSYSDPLVENTHYILINDPSEVNEKIKDIDQTEWNRMSSACLIWYYNNVHSDNCWNNMLRELLND